MLDAVRMAGRYATGLRRFLSQPLSESECRDMVRRQLERREQTFKDVLRRGVFENPRSPYRALLRHSDVEYRDAAELVDREGVEGALGKLYDSGVFVTLDEVKGRRPIRRGSFELAPDPRDFDNPLLTKHYESMTGGSRGPRTRLAVDLDLLRYEAAHVSLFVAEFGLQQSPTALWRELPPGLVGIKTCLRHIKLGRPVSRWFTWKTPIRSAVDLQFPIFTAMTRALSRTGAGPVPNPEYISFDAADRAARWLAERKREGTPALFDTNPSLGIRICTAALQRGFDISGTCFRFSGEPYTEGRAEIVRQAGCRAASQYSASELGHVGLGCGNPGAPDEVHVMHEKVGVIQRPKRLAGGLEVNALHLTTLMHNSPKLMLNVDLGDYATAGERDCGCALERMGFRKRLWNIRSYEKLTSAGVTFLGEQLVSLVERALPQRFGGGPLDYQFAEQERDGQVKVRLIVSPRVGPLDDQEVTGFALRTLRECPGGGQMTEMWRGSRTLEVVRQEPYATSALKLLPLHVAQEADEASSPR